MLLKPIELLFSAQHYLVIIIADALWDLPV